MSTSTTKNTSNITANQNYDKNKPTVPSGNVRTQRTTSDSVFSTTDILNKNKNKDDFTKVKDKTKRLLSSSSSSGKKESKKSKQLFISTNRYDPIAINDDMELETNTQSPVTNSIIEQEKKKIPLPPPIIVRGVKDFISVRADLIDTVGPENFSVKSTINILKIQPSNPEAYREIIHYLKDAEAEFHTYQMKEDKAFRIVIRNLHSTTTPIEIKTAIEEIGYSVRSVTNVLRKTEIEKIKLPLFFVDLEPAEINNNIFEVNNLLHTKIKIEEPYKRRIIIQCQNCQEYGHSKAYCSYPPRCVRCAAHHLTSTCTKPRDTPAKCVLCNGEHPANYKGCQIHKNLQKLRIPNARNQQPTINMQSNHIHATALRTEIRPPPPQQRSYANVTSNQEPPNTQTNQLDTGTMLTSFINDFKALINPLLSLLTTVLNKLIQQNDK